MTDHTLRDFVRASRFGREGAIVTDLDGTAVHEFEGRIVIPDAVSHGLKRLRDHGRPVILNSLRFPLNVIRTFGREWYAITNAPLPLVSLNGGLMGSLFETQDGEIAFEEIHAFPLTATEIDEVLVGVRGLTEGGISDLLLFYYPRDWTQGELIWTPALDKVEEVRAKYLSATRVTSSPAATLRDELHARDICMIFLLINAEQDRLMAYQHAKQSNFITHTGIDKLSGLEALAGRLGVDLAHAVGAGDTPMDTFLKGVGLAVHVGSLDLEYKGLTGTVKVRDSLELGDLLARLADLLHGDAH
ncbi:HAD family phosphatase [Microvirga puerhi]|uniref:HAD family phosphatase n=1 Tax=Microvirga puerhi TaxID=2876078 RepID=A0ABS7VRB2_9HYPH|nr:HAD family phosphatase [Microvirga puerhi]MBZ6078065.1 HAD family phosphatase [Microvirga puerhi]